MDVNVHVTTSTVSRRDNENSLDSTLLTCATLTRYLKEHHVAADRFLGTCP
jgi:hypothetical protein